MVLNVVGSSPTSHPRKERSGASKCSAFFMFPLLGFLECANSIRKRRISLLQKVCFSASRASHLCKLQSTSAIGVTQRVTEGVTHFCASHLVFPDRSSSSCNVSGVYIPFSRQKRLLSFEGDFVVCTLFGVSSRSMLKRCPCKLKILKRNCVLFRTQLCFI